MEKAGGVVRADLALSTFCSVGILSRVVQFLGGEVVSPRHDEVVLEIEGFVLTLDELTRNLAEGNADLLYGPFYLVCKHPVHRWDDLHWHVYEPLRKYEANMVVRGRRECVLKYCAERRVGICLGKKIFDERFN